MTKLDGLNSELRSIDQIAYKKCSLVISDFCVESEGKEYKACKFRLNKLNIICRNAKITPKKTGQFVTFWRRSKEGKTEPYKDSDAIDFYVINVIKKERLGQFVFPKSALLKNKILTSENTDGKRGFRVYPSWDSPTSKQAEKTQMWQSKYFIEFDRLFDTNTFGELYQNK